MIRLIHVLLGTLLRLPGVRRRDERGLSQSTENVILLVGAVTIAVVVIATVTSFVRNNLVLIP